MTTIRIDDTMIGLTIARSGVAKAGRFLVASRAVFQNLTLVDDGGPFAPPNVSKQIINDDLLTQVTNKNGLLKSPFVMFEDASIGFNNLTVKACPKDAVFEIDTTGALAWAEVEDQRIARDKAARLPPPPPYVAPIVAAVEPPPPPPARPKWMVDADAEAARLIEQAATARAKAQGPVVLGPSMDAIRAELFIAGHQRQVEMEARQQENAAMFARAAAIKAQRAAEQEHATALLREQGYL
jgi:hypothetical protein